MLGCLCYGGGDWLMMYGDPAHAGALIWLTAGTAQIPLWRYNLAMALAFPGILLYGIALFEVETYIKTEKERKVYHYLNAFGLTPWIALHRFWMTLLPVGWLIIHFTVSISIYVYSWCMHSGTAETAEKLATDIIQMMQPTQMVSWFFAGFPLVLLIVYVLRGKTVLKKRSQFFTPLLWMALLSGLKFVIPESPFSNAIDTFCMNAGLITWFVYLLVAMAEN